MNFPIAESIGAIGGTEGESVKYRWSDIYKVTLELAITGLYISLHLQQRFTGYNIFNKISRL